MTSIQVNIRTTKFLATELDRIVNEGYFRSRSEAMNEAIRILIRRYQLAKLESKLTKAKKERKIFHHLRKHYLNQEKRKTYERMSRYFCYC